MEPILAGLETEYGLYVEGRGAENQVGDAMALVRAFPGKRHSAWNYRHESPRSDLRGYKLSRLTFDPEDAKFDRGQPRHHDQEERADQVLSNGARFYNDHGHPEYATPECLSLEEIVLHDLAGEQVVLQAARAFREQSGHEVRLYKNNTDFHGASYGTHESYLVPRAFGFDELYSAVMPMLIARQLLCGAGKVGAESGSPCDFQLSQRADFVVEAASAETLYRRPLFNTRDEPHADPAKWIRLHVICGDANMIPSATRRKVGLVKLALVLMREGAAPEWRIPHPAAAFSSLSRDPDALIELAKGSWTNAAEILESYFSAAESVLGVRPGMEQEGIEGELGRVIVESRQLLEARTECPDRFREKVDWAAKRWLLDQVREAEGWTWQEESLRSYDLEYHRLEPDEGLYFALAASGEVEDRPALSDVLERVGNIFEGTRARARSIAVSLFAEHIQSSCWRSLTFETAKGCEEIDLPTEAFYPPELAHAESVESFIAQLRSLK